MHEGTSNGGSVHQPTEYTSLLSKPIDNEPWSDPESESESPFSRALILAEFWLLLKDSTPVILAYTLQNSLQTVSVLVIGRSSPENLAASAFSQMFAMVTAWMIALGGTTAMDTLASSSFTGSSNKHDLGILLQRGFLVLGLFYIPVAVLWAFSEPVFLFLGQDPQLSKDSARFLTCLIPGGWDISILRYIEAYRGKGIMRAGTYVLLITSPLNAALNYIFCYTFEIGLLGAPLATGLCYWLSFALLVLYARFISGSECWGGWSCETFQNLRTFARLALLGVVHVGTEWWAFEIVALAAGRLGTVSLAAQSVIMTADQVLNTIPFGIGVATSGRVGNLLGKRDNTGAARAAHTSALLSVVLGGVVLAVLMGTREHFAKIFNDDASVVNLTAEVLPYVALFQIADGLNGSCGGSLRGMGRQHVGALVNLLSYYCGALPLGIWLAFHGWGLKGLWVGQCIALYLVGALEWIIVARSQWDTEVRKAFQRMDVHEVLEDGVEEE
ncbi:Multi antimicrobial extrusion protein [Penicillium samsonianum]|uniref:Multi antimicrobial extrusion protein n=1 Tax=Penicillium samsonianum TaxID=1882272 RepID=UPI00254809B1|nr:Multi antimicrobial extrusion protein [Penicillium samsonianum]KAJ6137718.1 Multi antimicrobial extrusion protein [Penicillium samsonianum]